MIDNNKIEVLLNSFYDGRTTLEEEQILKEYFLTSKNIPAYLEKDRQLFVEMNDARSYLMPNDFDKQIEDFIDSLTEGDKVVKHINWKWVSRVAASIIIVVSLSIAYSNYQDNITMESKDTYTDVNQAYDEAERALLLISEKINKGEAQYAKAQTKVDDINMVFNKNINR